VGETVVSSQTQADKAELTLSAEADPGPALNVVPERTLLTHSGVAMIVSQLAAIYPMWGAVKTVIVETIKAE
jgi:hypothetical protein